MWLTDKEQMELLEDTTERISNIVTKALAKLRLATVDDVEKVWKVANDIDKRHRKQVDAEHRAAATLAAQLKDGK